MQRNWPGWLRRFELLPRRLAVVAATLLLPSLAGCLGLNYQFGARTLFPEGIETVYVPVFDSSSYRRELGEELTEAVVKEIERRSYYKVVSSPSADTILTGKITGETKHLLFQTLQGDPRDVEANLQVKVSWVDRRGSPIREIPAVPVPNAAVDISAASDFVGEVGQSVATSHQRAIQRLAEQIVSLMEKPW
ncbi:MAG: LPS assembly lipoprotein LptE [Thermoguttaceae bacterium]